MEPNKIEVASKPLPPDLLQKLDAYWRAGQLFVGGPDLL